MNLVKIRIPGKYYDSQIYSGRLYLWCTDNSIRVLNWDRLINDISVENRLRIALECAFRRSDYLYGTHWNMIFQDEEIRSVITQKFEDLSQLDIEIDEEKIRQAEIKHQENPLPFLHTDLTIYNEKLYVSSRSGVFQTTCNKKNKYPVSTRPVKRWDAAVLGLSASYGSLNLSAGHDGLFELEIENRFDWSFKSQEPQQLSKLHSSSSNWLYYSIFNTSHLGAGSLLDYEKKRGSFSRQDFFSARTLRKEITTDEIFGNECYTWGMQDKICQVYNNKIKVVQYFPWNDEDNRINLLGELDIMSYKGGIVSGNTAVYGVIIECDNGLIVLDSNLRSSWIDGEPINWRIFPRSKFYENHLHVIFDEYIDIYSFNNDYFVDQKQKLAGFIASNSKRFVFRSSGVAI